MKAYLKTFESGSGDCIFLRLIDNAEQFNIMIDCGVFTKKIRSFIEKECNKRIDLLVATHIDDDHIKGLVDMLTEMQDLQINKILFNCYQDCDEKDKKSIDDSLKQKVIQLADNLPIQSKSYDSNIGTYKAAMLSKTILTNDKWNNVWYKKYLTTDSEDIVLGDKWGTLKILSPTKGILEELRTAFRNEFFKLLKESASKDAFESQEEFYEIILRFLEKKEKPSLKSTNISAISKYDEKAIVQYANARLDNVSLPNKASIAFAWQHGDKRVLFLGDADSEVVAKAIEDKIGIDKKVYDAIKVSHHGSKHSTCRKLLDLIDSQSYIITGGNRERPSIETIARIILPELSDGVTERTLFFNRSNEITSKLMNKEHEALRTKLNFKLEKHDETSFEY